MITESPSFDLRYSDSGDEKHLVNWLMKPEVYQWFPMNDAEEIRLFAKNWIGFSRYKCSLTATLDRVPRGLGTLFLMPYRKVAHLCMVYLVVDPEFWRQGIGTALVRNLAHLARTYFHLESMHFELFEGCPLNSLLLKLGYQEVFHQDHFVKDSSGKYLARKILERRFL